MCPVTVWWLRPTRATVEALWIFPFLDNDATIGGLFRELPRYIAATQDVVIECGGKKVEWWRVHEKGLPNWSSCCALLWLFVTSLVPDLLSLGHGVTKPKLKNSQKITVLSKLENFYDALFSGKQRISLSTWLFWAKDDKRKLAVFLFNLPLQHHIYIFECIFTSRDDYPEDMGETTVTVTVTATTLLAWKMFTSDFSPWLGVKTSKFIKRWSIAYIVIEYIRNF